MLFFTERNRDDRILSLLENITNILFPPRCVFCENIITGDNNFECRKCHASDFLIGDNICIKCGRDIDQCMCSDDVLHFDRCIAPFYFTDIIRESIHDFKFRGRLDKCKGYSRLMHRCIVDKYSEISFDCVVPVPMYYKKQRIRGYNQSELLSKNIAKLLDIPVVSNCIHKIKDMTPQHELKDGNRFENIANTFYISNKTYIFGKNIIVVDDVLTTGSTLSECAKILKQFGAKSVYAVVIAETKRGE